MKNICPLSDLIHGLVKPGFEPIREGFIRTFTQRREVGAALICWSLGANFFSLKSIKKHADVLLE